MNHWAMAIFQSTFVFTQMSEQCFRNERIEKQQEYKELEWDRRHELACSKLTWLVLGGDPAARSHRVEQFTAL